MEVQAKDDACKFNTMKVVYSSHMCLCERQDTPIGQKLPLIWGKSPVFNLTHLHV